MPSFRVQRRLIRFFLLMLPIVVLLLILFTLTSWAANTVVWQSASTGLPISGLVQDVKFGDVNNDGKPDLIVASWGGGVQVYAGDGAGGWTGGTLSTGLPTTGSYNRVAVGDVNNDGKLDIAASLEAGGLVVFLGNGAGSWTPITTGLPATGSYNGVALGDVNWDGRLDLIAAGSGGVAPGINVYLSSGASFSQTTSPTTTGNFNEIAAGYVDNDGYIDIAAADNGGNLDFWKGGNNNSWTLVTTGLTDTTGFRGVAIGDVNNDGKPDLVASRNLPVGSGGGGIFTYLWNQTSQSWSLSPYQIPINNTYDQIALYDLNNDGWLDLVAGNMFTMASQQGLATWLGGPTGFAATTPPTTTGELNSVAVTDFDRDGLPDIAAGNNNDHGVLAWRDAGTRQVLGAWQPIASPNPTSNSRAFGIGDFNRDGNLDVVMERSFGAGLAMWLGDGGNTWTECPITETVYAQSGQYDSLVVGQFNRPFQEPDVIAGRDDGQGIIHFSQYGTNCTYWYPTQPITTTGSWRALAAGDLNNDSFEDFVAAPANIANAGLRLWLNGPNGFILSSINPTNTGSFYATALGDFNNDGKLDIAAADGGGGGVVVLKQGVRVTWSTSVVTSTGSYYAIAVGDFNNDGLPDIVAGRNSPDQGLDVFINQGAAGWALWPSPDPTGQYYDLSVGDFNHDGHLDIAGARNNGGVVVWAGDGAGNWTAENTNLPSTGTYWNARFGHIDHDGNLDILSTAAGGGLQMWTAAEATPPTISNIQPSGWISTTQSPVIKADLIDTGSGLNVSSGQYRYSTDGGGTWSALAPASISGSNGTNATQQLTTLNVPFGQDSATLNRIEVRGTDMVGNLAVAQTIVRIDTVPPTSPTTIGSDHTVSTWSNNNIVTLNWSGAADATSGVYGYEVLFDQNPTTLPPPTTTLYSITSAPSPALSDGTTWYGHVRTRDVAGNWSIDAVHKGPFYIDTTPPNNPTDVHSTSHTPSVWSGNSHIAMVWSGASDPGGSGVSGYAYVFDTNPGTLPPPVVTTYNTFATSGALSSSNSWYFHIRTRDAAGNWSATAVTRGPYWIDVTPPFASASSPASVGSTSFTVSWSGGDYGQSGVASYDVQYRDTTTGGSWITWQSFTTSTSATFFGTGGHIYQFRARARDHVGNVGSYTGGYDSQTQVATIDMYMRVPGIEVNQEVQDLNNSVVLIANKRTFVRCYAQSSGGMYSNVPGRLSIYRGATYMGTLAPSNSGAAITVKSSPDRSQLNDAYYFDVPTGWLSAGPVTFRCEVNTPLKYADLNYGNDATSTTITFSPSWPMNLLIVDVPYRWNGVTQHVRNVDRTLLESYIRRAYPINSLTVKWAYLDPPYGSIPDAGTVDNDLFWDKFWNPNKFFNDGYARYYGMAIDNGGFMRGLAAGIPSTVAAGPAGVPGVNANPAGASGWDFDQSYGDWYGAHELGHTYGRYHAMYCGATGGASYPYPNGDISPSQVQFDSSTLYGFDTSNPTVIPPSWKDIMTYCANEWLSKFTYEGIYSRMKDEKGTLLRPSAGPSEHLVVTGKILSPTDVITLSAFFRVPNSLDSIDHLPGDYHIRFLDSGGAQLSDYPFAPKFSPEESDPVGLINEAVPWVTGTHSIVILHNTTALITRTISAHTPIITLTAPNGGEVLSGSSYTVTWNASDADLDPLTYLLEYSTDNGATWNLLGTNITQTHAMIDLSLLSGTTQGLFRVWASDGVNTAFDASDATFSVPSKLPEITSITPISGTTYVLSQTVTLEGSAYDPEDNVLGDAQLKWTSSLQGVLGTGSLLQLTDLITGTHVITLTATDSDNNIATATTVITVTEEAPPVETHDLFLPLVLKNG